MIESFGVPQTHVAQWVWQMAPSMQQTPFDADSYQAGITSAVFSLSQCLTCIWWGMASDIYGRKPVVLICLTCAMVSTLFFGFSTSLGWAIFARILSGISNANVGIVRTMGVLVLNDCMRREPADVCQSPRWSPTSRYNRVLSASCLSCGV